MIDYEKVQSQRQRSVKPLAIEEFFNLSPDVISLGIGEPDFDTPKKAGFAAIAAIVNGDTSYPPSEGIPELRQELSRFMASNNGYDYSPQEILITVGGSLGLDCTMRAFIEDGDEVILPTPTFPSYDPAIRMCGGTVVEVATRAEDGFRLRAEDLRAAITERTKMVVLNYPNNPTGVSLTAEDYAQIADVLRDTQIVVLSDEIYSELTYDLSRHSILDQPGMRERTILVSGFSKRFAMTGWRIGYVCAPRELLRPVSKCHSFAVMCAPSIAQYAALAGLQQCEMDVKEMVEEYRRRRDYVMERFAKLNWPCVLPNGAFYAFPSIKSTGLSSEDFCRRLLREGGVAVVPGNGFGAGGEGFIRISYAYNRDILKAAFDRIDEFVQVNGLC